MMDRTSLNMLKQMIEVLNFKGDPALGRIRDLVIEAYRPYRPEVLVSVDGRGISRRKGWGAMNKEVDFAADYYCRCRILPIRVRRRLEAGAKTAVCPDCGGEMRLGELARAYLEKELRRAAGQ